MLPYDILVIATGAVYPEGSAANLLKASAEATTAANRVKELRDLGELLFPKMRIFLHRFSKRNNGKHVAFDVHTGPRCWIIFISSFFCFCFFFSNLGVQATRPFAPRRDASEG